jgi:intracellular sulfur oxidation DsrE/DsrF family protein
MPRIAPPAQTARRIVTFALIAAAFSLPTSLAAQTGEALIRKLGASTPIPHPSFVADKTVEYKVAWDVTAAPDKPDAMPAGLARPANFLMMADENGLDRKRVHLAVILHGGATSAVMTNEAYKALKGVDNPNIALIKAMTDAGVQVIVCGQSLANNKIAREQVLPFVKVATSATFARATLHAQGYATFEP